MANMRYVIRGDARLNRQLAKLSKPRDLFDRTIENHAKDETERMGRTPYPPELPNQKYVRTGDFGRGFRYFKRGQGEHGIKNIMPYAVWVAKRGMQNRRYHEWRWWTLEGKVEEKLPELARKLKARCDKELENS